MDGLKEVENSYIRLN